MEPVLETKRLRLRQFAQDLSDLGALNAIQSDADHMRYYPHPYSLDESRGWIERRLADYEEHGYSLWAVEDRVTSEFLGNVGPVHQSVDGVDELGVLLYGHARNAYWYGSSLSIEETRALAPYQNATGLQVTSAVLAGVVWMLENPDRGIVEADEMDFRRCLEVQMPYLGPVKGFYTDWTPLNDRPGLFPEDIDTSDPWQFRNILVR
jgi:RimJ/RimL family protein N-acetyltransferase